MREDPTGELDVPFSSPDAAPLAWAEVGSILDAAEIFWISTVRPDGRPHVTPLVAAWLGDALYFATGPGERKELNLRSNASCAMTTGGNAFRSGTDVVVEGVAERVNDAETLGSVADRFVEKYDWRFEVTADGLRDTGGPGGGEEPAEGTSAFVYRVRPRKVFAYSRGSTFGATRFRF